MASQYWALELEAEPIVPPWNASSSLDPAGSELQRIILIGFSDLHEVATSQIETGFVFTKVFTFKEHGEFFRGALIMARLRYAGDFYELLKRYETVRVTINKVKKEEK